MTILLQGAGTQTTVVTPADPIGDTLRADAIAYWKMEETSGSSRVDATGHGHDLTEYQFGALPIQQVVGKIGNAAKSVDNTSDAGFLYNDTFSVNFGSGYSVFGWFQFPQFVPADNNQINLFKLNGTAPSGIFNGKLWVGILTVGQNDMVVYEEFPTTLYTDPLTINTWHFFVWWQDTALTKSFIQIDNGTIYSADYVANDKLNTLAAVEAIEPSYTNNVDYCSLDEAGLLARPLTIDERSYLYNSGAGRALFPAP